MFVKKVFTSLKVCEHVWVYTRSLVFLLEILMSRTSPYYMHLIITTMPRSGWWRQKRIWNPFSWPASLATVLHEQPAKTVAKSPHLGNSEKREHSRKLFYSSVLRSTSWGLEEGQMRGAGREKRASTDGRAHGGWNMMGQGAWTRSGPGEEKEGSQRRREYRKGGVTEVRAAHECQELPF